ncbi:MAG: DNA repair protein RecO [Candidatus Kapaibacterium sp.]
MIEKTAAIVLHSRRYKDTSVLLSLYTREHGKVRLVAKGARRVKGGYGSAAMPLSVVEVTYVLKERRDLHTLRTAETVRVLKNITRRYEHMTTALAIVEVVEMTQPLQERNERLFLLLAETLDALDASGEHTYGYFAAFCVHCAEVMGFRITLPAAEELRDDGEAVFSFEDGRVVLPPIDPGTRVWRLPRRVVRLLARIAHSGLREVAEIGVGHAEQRELQDFFVRYYSFHLDKSVVFRTEDMMLGLQGS